MELDRHVKGPQILVGDFNADHKDIAVLQGLIDFEGWTDLGAVASRWGQIPNEFTCVGYNAKTQHAGISFWLTQRPSAW